MTVTVIAQVTQPELPDSSAESRCMVLARAERPILSPHRKVDTMRVTPLWLSLPKPSHYLWASCVRTPMRLKPLLA